VYLAKGKHSVAKSTIRIKSDIIEYIYSYLKNNIKLVEYCFDGSTQGGLKIPLLKQLKIPIPEDK
jgi:restriction endonuclease S subunit